MFSVNHALCELLGGRHSHFTGPVIKLFAKQPMKKNFYENKLMKVIFCEWSIFTCFTYLFSYFIYLFLPHKIFKKRKKNTLQKESGEEAINRTPRLIT